MFSGLRGDNGRLLVAGRELAGLADWSVSYDPTAREYRVAGRLVDARALWLRPGQSCEVRLHMPRSIWRWRRATLAFEGEQATLTGLAGEPDIM